MALHVRDRELYAQLNHEFHTLKTTAEESITVSPAHANDSLQIINSHVCVYYDGDRICKPNRRSCA